MYLSMDTIWKKIYHFNHSYILPYLLKSYHALGCMMANHRGSNFQLSIIFTTILSIIGHGNCFVLSTQAT